jgi:hypothetical protein
MYGRGSGALAPPGRVLGRRHGQIIDPFAHRWGLAQHLEDVPHYEVVRRAAVFGGTG